ncbi:MAG TPA: PQQ-binding-like beta-propeller repeat protein, partial [Verrucomicrobiae bacterium]|nr:PQQ-binding-like beta-propeller repeat protein [Verrucomicrobiae bacterium]
FEGLAEVVGPESVVVSSGGMVRRSGNGYMELGLRAAGAVRLEMVMESGWEKAPVLGLALCASSLQLGSAAVIAVSGGGTVIASGHESGRVQIWDGKSGNPGALLEGCGGRVRCLGLSADGRSAAAVGTTYCRWASYGREWRGESRPLPVTAAAVALAPSLDRVALADPEGQLLFWDAATGAVLWRIPVGRMTVGALAFSSDGRRIASATEGSPIQIRDVARGALVQSGSQPVGRVTSMAFSADGRSLAWWSLGSEGYHILDLAGGDERIWGKGTKAPAQVRMGGDLVAMVEGSRHGVVVRGVGEDIFVRQFQTHDQQIKDIALDTKRQLLYTAHGDGNVFAWRLQDGSVVRRFGGRGYRFLLGLSPEQGTTGTSGGISAARREGLSVRTEIYRDQVLLVSSEIGADRLPEGPLRLQAERQGQRVRLEVGDLPAFEFEDPFMESRQESGTFGVYWPEGVTVSRLRAWRQALPHAPTALERGDELFG